MKANVNFLKASDLASITHKLCVGMYGVISTDDRGTYEKISKDRESHVE